MRCVPPSGFYWIDPNEGSPKDAVRAFCQGAETCITPKNENSKVKTSSSCDSVCIITSLDGSLLFILIIGGLECYKRVEHVIRTCRFNPSLHC